MKFSQRMGYTPPRKAFQHERADKSLRTSLWNVYAENFWKLYTDDDRCRNMTDEFMKRAWVEATSSGHRPNSEVSYGDRAL